MAKTYLIDANIFLEVLLARENKDECVSFLKKVEEGEVKAFVSSFIIHAMEVILINLGKAKELETFLEVIGNFKGLSVYSTKIEEEREAIEIISQEGLDFDDALQTYIARKLNTQIVSFDKHFDRVKGIRRVEPGEILEKMETEGEK